MVIRVAIVNLQVSVSAIKCSSGESATWGFLLSPYAPRRKRIRCFRGANGNSLSSLQPRSGRRHFFPHDANMCDMNHSPPKTTDLPIIESCDGCGACCMQSAVPPYIVIDGQHEALLNDVPTALVEEIMPFWEIRFQFPERSCMWFDEAKKGCKHYEYRPQACRNFEINSSSCLAIRDKWEIEG